MIPSNSFNLETKLLIKASIGGTFYDFLDLTPTQAVGHGFDRRQQRQHQGVVGEISDPQRPLLQGLL